MKILKSKPRFLVLPIIFILITCALNARAQKSDTWSATDALGRNTPSIAEVGPKKNGKSVGMLYWTWHESTNAAVERVNLTQFLINSPTALSSSFESPIWQGYTQFIWDEPLFGYYRTTDDWVLRKHAEMLADAGVDFVVFDCSNGTFTWKDSYTKLLQVWNQAKLDGVNTPKIAFLLPFAAGTDTRTSLTQLYNDLYKPGLYQDLWFMRNSKPLIMAYPESLTPISNAAGMKFTATSSFNAINATCPTWGSTSSSLTFSLYNWNTNYDTSVSGTPIAQTTYVNFKDGQNLQLNFNTLIAGNYVWTLSNGSGSPGVWKWNESSSPSVSYFSSSQVAGNYQSGVLYTQPAFTSLSSGSSSSAVRVTQSTSAGMNFTATSSFTSINTFCPSWGNNIGNITLSLYNWNTDYATSVSGTPLAQSTFINFADNQNLQLNFNSLPAGNYVWVLSNGTDANGEMVGVWKWTDDSGTSVSYLNGIQTTGNYMSGILYNQPAFTSLSDGTSQTPIQIGQPITQQDCNDMSAFFTFRPGQPDYVNGPSRNDHWGWLEVYPQHAYPLNGSELVTVGVAQNANQTSGGQCAASNAPGNYSRNYTHNGFDNQPNSYLHGANFNEQWGRAFELNPEIALVDGWNEWIFGRFKNWTGCTGNPIIENSFPDAFDKYASRDIEPVKSWGDNADVYYMQLVNNVRKFKGLSAQDSVSSPKTVSIGLCNDWTSVKPEFTSYKGSTIHRNHAASGISLTYTNTTGRNDIVMSKVARDNDYVYFYVETAIALTSKTDPKWMRLFIDIDRNKATGWQGYDFVINRTTPDANATIEKSVSGWAWSSVGIAQYAIVDNKLELKIAKSILGIPSSSNLNFEFKWSDNMQEDGNIMDFYVNGDVAPSGRFNFVYNENSIASSSSFAYASLTADKAIDGLKNNFWSSSAHSIANESEWIYIDQSSSKPVGQVILYPRYSGTTPLGFPADFKIQYSNDALTWTDVSGMSFTNYTVSGSTNREVFGFCGLVNARYIRIYATKLNHDDGAGYYFQLAEIEVNGIQAITSSNANSSMSACCAMDGLMNNFWSSVAHTVANQPEWIYIDQSTSKPVGQVILHPRYSGTTPLGFPSDFKIQYSNNATTWTDVPGKSYANYTVSGSANGEVFSFSESINARYIRIYATKLNLDNVTNYYFQLAEIIVNGMCVLNSGFEAPATTTYQYGPFTNGWTFDGQSGVQKNGSIWNAPTAPEGIQTAFLQTVGSMYQNFNLVAGTYKVSFLAAKRSSNKKNQSIDVYCDGSLISNITPASSTSFGNYTTASFSVNTGTHQIKFAGVLTTDNTTFVDNVSVVIEKYKAPILLTGLESLEDDISIYPNPATDQITLSNVQINSQVTIFSLDGKKVYSIQQKDNQLLNIPLKGWYKGMYLVHIQTDNGNIVKKVIVK